MKFYALTGSKTDCLLGVADEWIGVNIFRYLYLKMNGFVVKKMDNS